MNSCGDTASRGGKAVNLNVTLQGCSMLMEQDTGAAVSIISEESFQRIAGKGVTIKPSSIRLTSYTGDTITMLGVPDGPQGQMFTRTRGSENGQRVYSV